MRRLARLAGSALLLGLAATGVLADEPAAKRDHGTTVRHSREMPVIRPPADIDPGMKVIRPPVATRSRILRPRSVPHGGGSTEIVPK